MGQILISMRDRKGNAVEHVLDLPLFFLKCVLLHLFIYLAWGEVHMPWQVWRSEENLEELVLAFYHVTWWLACTFT